MGTNRNYRGIDGNCREIDSIQGSHPPYIYIYRERERERERCTNALRNWFILPFISNVELQSCIYRRLALMSLAHMAQDNWLVNSTCAL